MADNTKDERNPSADEQADQDLKTPTGEPYQTGEVSDYRLSDDDDPDAQALAAAKAEAEAEERGGESPPPDETSADGGGEPAKPADQAQQPKPGEGEAAKPGDGDGQQQQPEPTIPLPRFREVLNERDTAIQQANYWKGRAEMAADYRQQQPAQQQPAEPPQPSVDDQVKALDDKIDEIGNQYDAGKISSAEFHRQTRRVERQIDDLRRAEQEAKQPRPQQQPTQQPTPSLSDEQILEQQATQLTANYPYIDVLEPGEINRLVAMAYADAQASGQPIESDSTRGTYRLRQAVAELSAYYGPKWHPQVQVQQPTSQQPPSGAQPPAQPQPSPAAQQRQASLNRADRMPPDTTEIGTGARPPEPLSEQRVLQMDPVELEEMAGPERQKLLEIIS